MCMITSWSSKFCQNKGPCNVMSNACLNLIKPIIEGFNKCTNFIWSIKKKSFTYYISHEFKKKKGKCFKNEMLVHTKRNFHPKKWEVTLNKMTSNYIKWFEVKKFQYTYQFFLIPTRFGFHEITYKRFWFSLYLKKIE